MVSQRKGFALIYLLLLSAVILMILLALLSLSESQIRQSRHGRDRAQALLAAEAGLAATMSELERDAKWAAGFDEQPLPGNSGTYSVRFASPSAASSSHSINNLLGDTPVESYHGPNTVAPKSALLVATGRSGISSKTVEALVVYGSSLPDSLALAASGRIKLRGDVRVTGVASLLDPTVVPVALHTNDEGAAVNLSYSPSAFGDSLTVDGGVTSSSSAPTAVAIQLAAPASVHSRESQVAPKLLPEINIEAMISDQSGSPGPAIPMHPTNLSFTGNNYYPGDVTINGDVTLDENARLLVKGNLTVNGSVKGNGALIVGGNTKLHGSAEVTADSRDYVSVLSRGHVVLSGFQGESYMDSLVASDPEAGEYWEDTKWALSKLQGYLETHSSLSPEALSDQMATDDAMLDSWMTILATHIGTSPTTASRQRRSDSSGYFMDRFQGATSGSTESFLHQRFQQLDDMFRVCFYDRNGNSPRFESSQLVDNYALYDPVLDGGLFDSVESWGEIDSAARAQVFQEINQMVQRFDYDRLGSAEFKGYVFTSGALIVKSDLNLLGAAMVNGRESVGLITVDGVTYAAGDLALLDNSRVTYVQEMFRGGVQNLLGAGKLDVKRWVNR